MANICCTKYAVSIFNRSEDIKGVPKVETPSRDLSHAPLGVNFSSREKGLDVLYYGITQNLKHVGLSIQKLWRSH